MSSNMLHNLLHNQGKNFIFIMQPTKSCVNLAPTHDLSYVVNVLNNTPEYSVYVQVFLEHKLECKLKCISTPNGVKVSRCKIEGASTEMMFLSDKLISYLSSVLH